MTLSNQQRLQSNGLKGGALASTCHAEKLIRTRNATKQPVHLTGPLDTAHHADVRTVDLGNDVTNQKFLKTKGVRKFHLAQPEDVHRFHVTVIPSHSFTPRPQRCLAPTDLARSYTTRACRVWQVKLRYSSTGSSTAIKALANHAGGSVAP